MVEVLQTEQNHWFQSLVLHLLAVKQAIEEKYKLDTQKTKQLKEVEEWAKNMWSQSPEPKALKKIGNLCNLLVTWCTTPSADQRKVETYKQMAEIVKQSTITPSIPEQAPSQQAPPLPKDDSKKGSKVQLVESTNNSANDPASLWLPC
jgi:hypothetical protein